MSYVAVDKDGSEAIFEKKPDKNGNQGQWLESGVIASNGSFSLPKGSIEKLIGKKLTWEDDPVELGEKDEL